ncbi:MAG: TetR family transcriptional regulator [Firmicutes bacterium]|nr:TetR family transcriptional regulator [Bacillota bacterium]
MSDSQLTKKAMAQAMKELMKQKPMDKITIGEITERCFMSRKSFYYHFKDKYDLVNWIYYTEFLSEIQNNVDGWGLMEHICQYFYENRVFYCNALQVQAQNSFSEYFADILHPIISGYLDDIIENNENKDFFVSFFTDATKLAITRWLIEDAKTPPSKFVQLMKEAMAGVGLKIGQDMSESNCEIRG